MKFIQFKNKNALQLVESHSRLMERYKEFNISLVSHIKNGLRKGTFLLTPKTAYCI